MRRKSKQFCHPWQAWFDYDPAWDMYITARDNGRVKVRNHYVLIPCRLSKPVDSRCRLQKKRTTWHLLHGKGRCASQ